jgi:uncharacterized UPF0160 family protein
MDNKALYFQKDFLWKFEIDVKNKMDTFNEYLPTRKVINAKELEKMEDIITADLKEKFNEYLVNIDSEFAKTNYRYVLTHLENEKV